VSKSVASSNANIVYSPLIRPGALIAGCWAAMQYMGTAWVLLPFIIFPRGLTTYCPYCRGYLASCREIVTAARTIADAITDDIPELYVLGNPPASVVAFASKHPDVDPLEVGDGMSKRGWHLNGLSQPKSVHIACTVRISLLDLSKIEMLIHRFFCFLFVFYEISFGGVRGICYIVDGLNYRQLDTSNLEHDIQTRKCQSNQQRLTLPLVDQFIADLKDSVREAKVAPSGKGSMVAVYGTFFCPFLFLLLLFLHPGCTSNITISHP